MTIAASHPDDQHPAPRPLPRGCLRRLVAIFLMLAVVIAAGGIWMNLHGGKILVRMLLHHQLGKAGWHGDCEIDGTLLGGMTVKRAEFHADGPIALLRVERLGATWHWRELLTGKIRTLAGDGVALVVDLSPARGTTAAQRAPASGGASADVVRATVQRIWEKHVKPVQIELRSIKVDVVKDGRCLIALAPSDLRHAAGADSIGLALGPAVGPDNLAIEAQSLALTIGADAVVLDKLGLPDNWQLAGVRVDTAGRAIDFEARHHGTGFHARWDRQAGEASVLMDDGDWDLMAAMRPWLPVPPQAALRLARLHLTVADIHQAPEQWRAHAAISMPVLGWQHWQATDIGVEADWQDRALVSMVTAHVHGSPVEARVECHPEDHRFGTGALKISAASPAIGPVFAFARDHYFAGPVAPLAAAMEINAALGWRDGRVRAIDASADFTGIRAAADAVPDTRLAVIWPVLDGPLDASLQMTGMPGDGITVKARIDPRAGSYDGGITTDAGWRANGTRALVGAAWAGVVPELPATAIRWQGKGNWRQGSHQGDLAVAVPRLGIGPVPAAALEIEGSYDWPRSLDIPVLHASAAGDAVGMAIHWENNRAEIKELTVKHAGEVICRGALAIPLAPTVRSARELLAAPGPIAASLAMDPRPLAYWQQWLPGNLRQRITGTVGAALDISGDFAAPVVDARINGDGLVPPGMDKLPPARLAISAKGDAAGQLRIHARLDQADIEPVELAMAVPFAPRDWLDDPGQCAGLPLAGTVKMTNLQLGRYAQLAPWAKEIAGTCTVAVEISGRITAPAIRGRISLANGRCVPRSPNIGTLDRANLTIDFDGTRASVSRGEAVLGEGKVSLAGGMDFAGFKDPGITLKLTGDHVMIWRDDDLLVRASPVLELAGKPGAWKVQGTIAVVESMFFRDFELIPIGKAFTVPQQPELPRFDAPPAGTDMPGWLSTVTLDVRVATGDPVLIRGNLAKGMVTADIHATGSPAQPSLAGSAILHDVVARLPFSSLKVPRGTVLFVPGKGWMPELHVDGESTLPPYKVNVAITGPADAPKLNLSSEPPLPPSEILALLASGSTTASLENTANAQGKAMQLLIAELRNGSLPFGRRLGDLLAPLDHIQVQVGQDSPYDGRSRNGASIELTDRLLLTGSMDAEGNQRLTLTLLFRFR